MRAGPALLVRVGLLLILATATIGTSADADLWGHLRFGQDILKTRAIVQVDEYSFTSDRPWINHEWLSEVAFAGAYRAGGATGLVVLKLLIIAALLALVWRQVRRVAPASDATIWIIALTCAGTYWRMHSIRPQLFSVLLFACLLALITRADDGRRRGLLLAPLVMVLWVNLHGGWIVGLGVLGFWTTCRLFDGGLAWRPRAFIAAVGLTSVAATLINPYRSELWRFMAETVRLERTDIQDWNSVLADPAHLAVPWALVRGVAVWAVVRGGWPRRREYVAIVALAAVASFRVGRLDAFLAIAVVFLLTPQIIRALPRVSLQTSKASRTGVLVVTVVAILVMAAPAVRVIRPYVGCVTIGGAWAPDADAARFIALNHLRGRMLTWFDWGEYAIWHFGPDLQVSMDGRRETVYLDRTIQAHRRFYEADASAANYLRALNPDYIWLPRSLPIASTLGDRGWEPIFDSPLSRVFARQGRGPFQAVTESDEAATCFPGL